MSSAVENNTIKSNAQLEEEYNRSEEEAFNEYNEFRKDRLRKAGIKVPESELGDSVHAGTIQSYKNLGMEVPDSVRLATLRPNERVKHYLGVLNQNPKINTILRNVCRVKDEVTEEEYLVYSCTEIFQDPNKNVRKLDYFRCGTHIEVFGDKKLDSRYKVIGSEVKGKRLVFDIKWSAKQFQDLLDMHNESVKELKKQKIDLGKEELRQPDLIVGYGKANGHDVYSRDKRRYTIRNAEDFMKGSVKELIELGERGLSTKEPSLHRLKQPIAEDPANSLHKRQRGYINPNQISYAQSTYR